VGKPRGYVDRKLARAEQAEQDSWYLYQRQLVILWVDLQELLKPYRDMHQEAQARALASYEEQVRPLKLEYQRKVDAVLAEHDHRSTSIQEGLK
jgi:hypothetical protein